MPAAKSSRCSRCPGTEEEGIGPHLTGRGERDESEEKKQLGGLRVGNTDSVVEDECIKGQGTGVKLICRGLMGLMGRGQGTGVKLLVRGLMGRSFMRLGQGTGNDYLAEMWSGSEEGS
jgi:hypothetical protein